MIHCFVWLEKVQPRGASDDKKKVSDNLAKTIYSVPLHPGSLIGSSTQISPNRWSTEREAGLAFHDSGNQSPERNSGRRRISGEVVAAAPKVTAAEEIRHCSAGLRQTKVMKRSTERKRSRRRADTGPSAASPFQNEKTILLTLGQLQLINLPGEAVTAEPLMTVIMELYASKVNRSRRRRQWKWRWPIGQPPRNGKVVSAQVKRITLADQRRSPLQGP